MNKHVRRIVTGHNEAGRSVFIADSPAPDSYPALATPAMQIHLLWRTTTSPATFDGNEEMCPEGLRIPTAPEQRGGTVFRIADIPPDGQLGAAPDMARHGVNVSAEGRKRHVMFHQTNTVDYAIVIEGEIWAMMDDDEVLMKQGDVLIQRGTGHAWSNRSDKPCRIAFILVDAESAKR